MDAPVTFAVDPLYDEFFWMAKRFYWFMPLGPYKTFITPPVKTSKEYYVKLFWYYFVISSQFTLCSLDILFLIDPAAHKGSFLTAATTASWLLLAISSYQTVYFAFNSTEGLHKLFLRLHELFPKEGDERSCVDAVEWTRLWNIKMKTHTTLFIGVVVAMCPMPFMSTLARYIWTGEWRSKLPLDLWLPVDGLEMPYYPFIYIMEAWFFLLNVVPLLAIESIMGAVTMLICLQFKIVAQKFRCIKYGDYSKDVLAVREAIEYHNRILDLSLMSKEVFSVTLFVIFATASMVACIFMFLIMTEDDVFTKYQYGTNLTCFIVYISVFTYFGNEMIEWVSCGWGVRKEGRL